MTAERCLHCDLPIATQADYEATSEGEGGSLCWLDWNSGVCLHPAVNWRARALTAEAEVAAKQRGYDDLHAMVTGSGDIWTKVDKLLQRMAADKNRSMSIESQAILDVERVTDRLGRELMAVRAENERYRSLAEHYELCARAYRRIHELNEVCGNHPANSDPIGNAAEIELMDLCSKLIEYAATIRKHTEERS